MIGYDVDRSNKCVVCNNYVTDVMRLEIAGNGGKYESFAFCLPCTKLLGHTFAGAFLAADAEIRVCLLQDAMVKNQVNDLEYEREEIHESLSKIQKKIDVKRSECQHAVALSRREAPDGVVYCDFCHKSAR